MSHTRLSQSFVGRAALLLAVVVAAAGGSACSALSDSGTPPNEVRAFTGAHARVVWVQGDGTDPYAAGRDLVLMGFDTDDGQGERVVLGERQSYVKPMLTPRGDRVVFSTSPVLDDGPQVFVVNWDGSGRRHLADGFALALWENPLDGSEWVYLGTDNEEYNFATVSRFPISDPSAAELVWNQTLVSGDTFQVSADGRFAGGLFPWPEAGIAELPNRSWRKVGEGCWTALSTVRGPVFWYFDGAHRNLLMFDQRTENRWTIPINTAPGFDNPEVYHPRWTNHPRFLALSGPYDRGGDNQVRSGGTQAEIWLGRFSEDFSTVEGWVRVTHNEGGDSYPDVWIDRDRSPHAARASGPIGPPPAPADRSGAAGVAGSPAAERVVVQGSLRHAGPVPSPQSILPYRNALVVSEYDVESVDEGAYVARTIRVAHWAIRDSKVLDGSRRTPGARVRLTVERYDAHPELEGERLITDLSASDLPLYYDVTP